MLGVLQGVLHASSESHCCFGGEKKREEDVSWGVFFSFVEVLGVWIYVGILFSFSFSSAYLGSCLTEVEAAC